MSRSGISDDTALSVFIGLFVVPWYAFFGLIVASLHSLKAATLLSEAGEGFFFAWLLLWLLYLGAGSFGLIPGLVGVIFRAVYSPMWSIYRGKKCINAAVVGGVLLLSLSCFLHVPYWIWTLTYFTLGLPLVAIGLPLVVIGERLKRLLASVQMKDVGSL